MKTLLGIAAVLTLNATAWGQSFTAPAAPRKVQPQATPPPLTTRDISGVIPRAIRGGNPVQMVNPRAPARYGTAEQSVMLKPDGSGKWNGIKLFTIYF